MANQRKLGIYWGTTGISLVELSKDVPVEATFVSFAELERTPAPGVSHFSEDPRLLDLLKQALTPNLFSIGNAFLSLPSSDIIVRWLVVPWVRSDEIQGIVRFEVVKKHIPFSLEELVFNYFPTTITIDGVRKIGIAFTAIRKIHYDRLINVFTQVGVNVVYSEPAPMSLLRALVMRKLVKTDQVTAMLTAREDFGEISVVSQGHLKFLRDFSLKSGHDVSGDLTADFIRARFFNEIRVSLDFFARQNAGSEVEKAVALSSSIHQSMFDSLSDEITLPVQMVDPYQILSNFKGMPDIAYVRAFGVGLSGMVPSVIDLNLSEGQTHANQKTIRSDKFRPIPVSFLLAGVIVIVCAVSVVASFMTFDGQVKRKEAEKAEVVERLGIYADISREELESKINLLVKKHESVNSLSLKSDLTRMLVHLVGLMPQGMWFDKISVVVQSDIRSRGKIAPDENSPVLKRQLTAEDFYPVKSAITISVSGFVSLKDHNAEFQLINQFFEKIKADTQFRVLFSNIKLKSLEAATFNGLVEVSRFSIDFN